MQDPARCYRIADRLRSGMLQGGLAALLSFAMVGGVNAQDILSSQLRGGFGMNKVRYKDFDWQFVESEHLLLYFEPEFEDLAEHAVADLEEAYDHISAIMRHELSTKPPIVIFKSHYEFQQTNIIQAFLPPGVAGFAEPLRYRMVIPFNGDLEDFRSVLWHELMHIFQYDVVNRGPVRRISNPIANPPTWIVEGMAEYATEGMNTIDEMVLRDAVLTDQLIPLEVMNSSWNYLPNLFLAYKQSHSLMGYIAANFGPEKVGRILRVWDQQTDTDKLLKRLIDMDMKTLDERWQAHMRKQYWPLLKDRDYVSELATRVVQAEDVHSLYASPDWSLGGDMLSVLSTDGVEQHVDIIRLSNGKLVQRVTEGMRTSEFDELTFNDGTVAWAPDGHTIAFVAKRGPADVMLSWDLYDEELTDVFEFEGIEIIENLDWGPDSRRIAFIGTGYGQSDVYVRDINTGALTQITGSPQREDHPSFSPDGRTIAFSVKNRGQFDIRGYDFETGKTRTLVASPRDDLWPEWLPEGNKLLFVSTRNGINDLFLWHLEQQREYRLTRTVSGIMGPSLSPDGKQLVLSTYYHSRRELYRMDMPSWPEIQRQSKELASRVQSDEKAEGPPIAREADDDATVVMITTGDTGAAAMEATTRLGLDEAVAMLDRKARGNQAVKLAGVTESAESFSLGDDSLSANLVGGEQGSELSTLPSLADEIDGLDASISFDTLPRRRYTPKLEFDGISLQMGYYSGFLSGVAQLSMSDLLGNHSVNMFTDYVGSQEINNDLTFAVDYTYYGGRPTYSVTVFNWNQYFNDTSGTGPVGGYYPVGANQLTRGLIRSRQSGVLADATYPLDVYRRIELSYSFVDEAIEIAWPVNQPQESSSTHLFKTAYVHDSLNNGLLGPTSGRRYYLSVGRTVVLTDGDRSFAHLEADYRHYSRLGRWSVLGLRAVGVGSLGPDGLHYNLGGPAWFLPFFPGYNLNVGPLRGFPYSEFSGSRVVLFNSEVRVPFIRNITFAWPGVFSIPAIDGSFFADLGGAWNGNQSLDLWPLQDPNVRTSPLDITARLHGSVGFGLLVYFLAPMNFEFARRTDFKEFSDWRMHFSFGKAF
ncbi:MAG: peptidase MA family metallohydrolase [Candidatus Latescibacterota bacterium]|nr:peptidase MA family metallohydrolase [Candidatus Latescibacterota bacterium]